MAVQERIILGIDPGSNKMGYGVIRVKGKEAAFVEMGYIDLSKREKYEKLGEIMLRMNKLLERYKPAEVAFEAPFFGANVQSMLKLGRAQGVAIAAAAAYGAEIFEYAPRKVKSVITGRGAASKEQVANLLKAILKLEVLPRNLDSTDGLAVALCHFYQSGNPMGTKGRSSWESFVKSHPEKVIGE